MKRLVLNMVCRLKTDSGKTLVRIKSSDSDGVLMRLKTDSDESIPVLPVGVLPLFLRDVGKYYWNKKNIILQYRITPKKCSENGYFRMFRFFTFENLFFQSCIHGHLDTIKYLTGKSMEHIRKYFDNFLCRACENGHLEVVKYLTEIGADVNHRDGEPLCRAAEKGYLDIIKFLVEKGADLESARDFMLSIASEYGHLQVVKFLVEHGTDVHNDDGQALECACREHHFEVAKYLIENGANIHAPNVGLDWLLGYCDFSTLEYLIEKGLDIKDL